MPLSNAEKQKRFRERQRAAESQLKGWAEFLEQSLGADRVAQLRLEFLAQEQLRKEK